MEGESLRRVATKDAGERERRSDACNYVEGLGWQPQSSYRRRSHPRLVYEDYRVEVAEVIPGEHFSEQVIPVWGRRFDLCDWWLAESVDPSINVGAKADTDGRDDYLCDDHATSGDVSENARAVENEAARARMKGEQRMVLE